MYYEEMEGKARVGRSMSVDEVADLLGWTEAEKAAHLRSLDERPTADLDEAKSRITARTE